MTIKPYQHDSTNLVYNLLFCDDPELFKRDLHEPYPYPFDIVFSKNATVRDLENVITDSSLETRARLLAYNKLLSIGGAPSKKELLAVVVEVGLDEGLDTLASFRDGSARYIHYTEKIIIWETSEDQEANDMTDQLFQDSLNIVKQIGPWGKPRKQNPPPGNVRLSFLVSDGIYFGEGPINVLFNDPMAKPALDKATELMQFLTRRSLADNYIEPSV